MLSHRHSHRFFSALTALVTATSLAAMATTSALAGDCDGDNLDNDIVCAADPTTPDDEVGLGLGDDSITISPGVTVGPVSPPPYGSVSGDGDEFGIASSGDGGSDLIIIDGTVNGPVMGDLVINTGGDDAIFISNTGVVNGDLFGDDVITGDAGSDLIIIDGTLNGSVYGDMTILGDGESDFIVINGTVTGNVYGDNSFDNGGDDLIIITGMVAGDVYSDNFTGANGDDIIAVDTPGTINGGISSGNGDNVIIIFGAVNGTLHGPGSPTGIDAGDGYDHVLLGNGAVINNLIDGGASIDSLYFDFLSMSDLVGQSAAGGTLTYNGQTYTWANFEQLVGLLAQIPSSQTNDNVKKANKNMCLVLGGATGIEVFSNLGTKIAFIPFASLPKLDVGDRGSLTLQASKSAGWFVEVFKLGSYDPDPSLNWFQFNVYNGRGKLMCSGQRFVH